MSETTMAIYKALNALADLGGVVVFGGSEDKDIPLGELKQTFALQDNMYNRSIEDLSVFGAKELYDMGVAPLQPDVLFLHIGAGDIVRFCENEAAFVAAYHALIVHIKQEEPMCRVVVVSLKNYDKEAVVERLNKQLQYIAESECCEFADIADKRVWNPKGTREAVRFVFNTGFVHPLRGCRPHYDLVKILFCYTSCRDVPSYT